MSATRKGSNHALPAQEQRRRRVRELTVPEIESKLRDEGIDFPSKARKDELVELYAKRGGV